LSWFCIAGINGKLFWLLWQDGSKRTVADNIMMLDFFFKLLMGRTNNIMMLDFFFKLLMVRTNNIMMLDFFFELLMGRINNIMMLDFFFKLLMVGLSRFDAGLLFQALHG